MRYAAAGSSSSTKRKTIQNSCLNEDTFEIKRLNLLGDSSALFIGVFDGHGGKGAAQYVAENLRPNFEGLCKKNQQPDEIRTALYNSFLTTDANLYSAVANVAERYKHLRRDNCSCNFYREMPCRCLHAERSAHEGCTGTAVVYSNNKLYVANVGDSEALLLGNPAASTPFRNKQKPTSKSLRRPRPMSFGESPGARIFANPETTEEKSDTSGVSDMEDDEDEYEAEVLTVAHTPSVEPKDEDYLRIKRIAETRKQMFKYLVPRPVDGIRRGSSSRLNYVTLEGAHSLNMTRAFGNFGHKSYSTVNGRAVLQESESPVTPRPDIRVVDLSKDQYFLVVATDGLWDNLCKSQVSQIVRSYCSVQLKDMRSQLDKLKQASVSPESILADLAKGAATELLTKAIETNKKADDITVVIVLFEGLLEQY